MSGDGHGADFGEFKAGFLVEVDEYVQLVENALLELEGDLGTGRPDKRRLQEIFRAAHTIKALAAMLEFEPIVELCHRLESVLRAMERDILPFTATGVDTLVESTKSLSSLVEDVRSDRTLARPSAILQQLDDLLALSVDSSATLPAPSGTRLSDAGQATVSRNPTYEVRFSPTSDLVAKGVTINAIRETLSRMGELVEVRPEVDPNSPGQLTFVLIVSSEADEATLASAIGLGTGAIREISNQGPQQPPQTSPPLPTEQGRQLGVLRVDISKLDDLMRLVGELVINRARIGRAVSDLNRTDRREAVTAIQESTQQMERNLRDLREAVMRVRLVEVRQAFGRMHLVARDAARAAGRQVRLETSGEETEVDKVLVDRLTDPLIHLVRNAVDHGIEPPVDRASSGKGEVGTIRLSARPEGDRVVIQVSDDGRGIDREKVAARAAPLGFDPAQVRSDDEVLMHALCHPGLSTRDQAGRTSGRGVGMDVVWQRVREMGGSMELSTRQSTGTTFTLRLPLTLAIVEALTASCGGQRFAIPINAVDEVAEIPRREIVHFEGNEILQHRGQVLPVLRLNRLFHLGEEYPDQPYLHAVVVDAGGSRWVMTVDRLIGEQEVVVKTMADTLVRTPGVVGATDLGDGQLVLILDLPELVRAERDRHQNRSGGRA